jgi:hypothetical protein
MHQSIEIENRVRQPSADKRIGIQCPNSVCLLLPRRPWRKESAVENVAEIQFSDTPFDRLAIPEDKKRVIKSLTESRVRATSGEKFDDIMEGKGEGIIILLQYVSKPFIMTQLLTVMGKRSSRCGEDFDSRRNLRTTSATALLGI